MCKQIRPQCITNWALPLVVISLHSFFFSCSSYKVCGLIVGKFKHIQFWMLDWMGNCLIWLEQSHCGYTKWASIFGLWGLPPYICKSFLTWYIKELCQASDIWRGVVIVRPLVLVTRQFWFRNCLMRQGSKARWNACLTIYIKNLYCPLIMA
jgi:hypothetical protein